MADNAFVRIDDWPRVTISRRISYAARRIAALLCAVRSASCSGSHITGA